MQRVYNANGSWEPSGDYIKLAIRFLFCNLKCDLPGAFHLKWYLIELLEALEGRDLGFVVVVTYCKAPTPRLQKTKGHFYVILLILQIQ